MNPDPLVAFMSWGVVVVFAIQGLFKLYLQGPLRAKMDTADRMGRYGEAAYCFAISAGTMLLIIGLGPEWRLPAVFVAGTIAVIGRARDVRRQWLSRRR